MSSSSSKGNHPKNWIGPKRTSRRINGSSDLTANAEPNSRTIDYLVGGLRISLSDESTTPGPKSHIQHFTVALSQAGHRVRIIFANDTPGLQRFKNLGEGYTSEKNRLSLIFSDLVRMGASLWSGIWLFGRSAATKPPEVLYERIAVFQSLSSFHARKKRTIRVVESNGLMAKETAHDRNGIFFERLASKIERHAYRRADFIVAVSKNLATQITVFAGVPADKILVIPNAIPNNLIEVQRQKGEEFIVGFSGSLVAWQQLGQLISAFAECRSMDVRFSRNVVLEIIGDGPVKDDLKRLVSELSLDGNVRFIPRMPQTKLFASMSKWNVGYAGHERTSSAVMYHSPLKMYEYAGLGLAAICTSTPDAASLEEAGMKVYYFEDVGGLSDALLRAYYEENSHTEDHDRRNEIFSKHSWQQRASTVMKAIDHGVEGSTVEH